MPPDPRTPALDPEGLRAAKAIAEVDGLNYDNLPSFNEDGYDKPHYDDYARAALTALDPPLAAENERLRGALVDELVKRCDLRAHRVPGDRRDRFQATVSMNGTPYFAMGNSPRAASEALAVQLRAALHPEQDTGPLAGGGGEVSPGANSGLTGDTGPCERCGGVFFHNEGCEAKA